MHFWKRKGVQAVNPVGSPSDLRFKQNEYINQCEKMKQTQDQELFSV